MEVLLRTKLAYESSMQHLKDSSSEGSDVESYLSQYLLVLMCAEMQVEVQKLVDERASRADKNLYEYISSSTNNLLRSVKSSELSGFLSRFGNDVKDLFTKDLDERAVSAYNNAVNNRHKVAHKDGVKVTFSEIEDAISASEEILKSVRISLGLPKI